MDHIQFSNSKKPKVSNECIEWVKNINKCIETCNTSDECYQKCNFYFICKKTQDNDKLK